MLTTRCRPKRALRDERGFTLMEMLVAMSVGTIVLLAAFNLVDGSLRASQRVSDRVDAAQNGRGAMEQIVQQLRSSVCLDDPSAVQAPVAAGDATSVSFYANLLGASGVGTTAFQPELRRVYYDAATRSLVEQRSAGVGTYPALTFPNVTGTRLLATNVHPVPGVPMFSFYAYKADNTVDPFHDTPLAVPLSPGDRALTGVVRVAFVSGPARATNETRVESSFDEAVPLRLVDLTHPQDGPVCRV